MKKEIWFFGVIVAALALLHFAVLPACAQWENEWSSAQWEIEGASIGTRRVAISSTAAAEIAGSSTTRTNLTCVNENSYSIRIGTAMAGTTLNTLGLYISSGPGTSFSFKTYTGALYAINAAGNGVTGYVSCLDSYK